MFTQTNTAFGKTNAFGGATGSTNTNIFSGNTTGFGTLGTTTPGFSVFGNTTTQNPFGSQTTTTANPANPMNQSNPTTPIPNTTFGGFNTQPSQPSLIPTTSVSPFDTNTSLVQILKENQGIQKEILTEIQRMNAHMKQNTQNPPTNMFNPLNQTPIFTPPSLFNPPPVVHTGVNCDVCKKLNICGNRWKCLFCKDFDICEDCEKLGKMDSHEQHYTHYFIKIRDTNTFNMKLSEKPLTFMNM